MSLAVWKVQWEEDSHAGGQEGRDSACIMCMGMLLTRTHCYVAEFGLHFGLSASQEPASALTFPGSRPGAPPTGHRAQTP